MRAFLMATALAVAIGAAPAAADTFIVDRDPTLNVDFRLTAVAEGLEHPFSIAWLPDGTALVTERPGRLRAIRNGRLDPTPVAGTPQVLLAAERGLVFQSGLFEVSPHPNFAQNRLLYLTCAAATAQGNRLTLARATFDGQSLGNLQVLWQNPQDKPEFQHYGGRIAWLPDGTMLVTVGDGGNPPVAVGGQNVRNNAQILGSAFGKVIRLRDDGTVPPDNPFVNQAGARPEVFSYGHRHSQGIAVDPTRGNMIWSTEHGPLGADELNIVRAGANYGWPAATWGVDYVGGAQISPVRSQAGMQDPVLLWSRSVAPSGLVVYTGDRFPQWRGSVISGSLAYQDLRRTWFDASGRVAGHESLRIGQRVRDVRQGPDGFLYVLTDEIHGRVFRVEAPN